MNLGLTTSFIIGGLLMLLIVTLNLRMGQHGAEITLHEMSKTHIEAVYEMAENDFRKVAYNYNEPLDGAIKIAEDNRVIFESNLYNDTTGTNIFTIGWDFQKEGDERIGLLERIESTQMNIDVPSQTVITDAAEDEKTGINVGITRFELKYYEAGRTFPMTTPVSPDSLDNIRRVEVIIETQPRGGIAKNGSTYYPTSQWRKVFVPSNLNL
jgi:hypothetical protein